VTISSRIGIIQAMPGSLRIRGSTKIWNPPFDMERGTRPPSPSPAATESPYVERLVKLIPAEVIAIYLFGTGAIPPDRFTETVAWAATCLVLVFVARAFTTRDAPERLPPQWAAVGIACISFVIWIFAMPGLLQGFGISPPFVGSLAIAVWTFLVPYVYKG
jgi:hypothetical protein